ncbi:aminoglycoside phosphotransferase family protein [Streptomyces sp. NPDC088124]|uniref:phosphotransferase family protein n=1 Tax=Streptomyces sp. NPDC088124 TaxID=3154654 RepID=UPI003425FE22
MTPTPPPESLALLQQITEAAHLPAHGAEVIRLAENDLWRLPAHGGIVVRIARAGQDQAAAREVALTRWLADHQLPAVIPLDMDQPVQAAGRSATFWEELPAHHAGKPHDLAPLLLQLHTLPAPDHLPLPPVDPFVRIADRINAARMISASDRAFLHNRLKDLRNAWQNLPPGKPSCVIHGDAWGGNVAVTPDGRRYLLDFERASLGPPEWDLTSTAVAADTFGTLTPYEYAKYCNEYGYDVRTYPGYTTLRAIRELRLTTFALQTADQHLPAHDEATYRLSCLQGHHGPRPWYWRAVI